MNNYKRFISSKKQFEESLNLIKKVFNYEKRLPEQVFKMEFSKNYVFDFDIVMSSSFWGELERLVTLSDDQHILMAVLDPHPESYYYKEFSQYNWCILSRNFTEKEYWETIESSPEASPADAIVFNSETIVWVSSSMKWAMWGERSYGICILGISDGVSTFESEVNLTLEQAINELVSLNFGGEVSKEVVSKLMMNY
ncbi:diadenosine tetraphosphatase [Marinicrinis sediminis]|uniref:Diadenosine tetraphosphatase n=1 Tax=Marinicrinis sediminis TaxID=1652465 RepID=A0ABW5RB33_9BACL